LDSFLKYPHNNRLNCSFLPPNGYNLLTIKESTLVDVSDEVGFATIAHNLATKSL
jgi:hypothetical protein